VKRDDEEAVEPFAEFVERIRQHFPALTVERVRELPHVGWGGDSDALLVNDALVFRFPRRPEVAEALAVEVCLLPALAPRMPVAIPDFRYVAYPPAHDASEAASLGPTTSARRPLFVGYPTIEGEPLTPAVFETVAAEPALVERMAAQLGGFLSALHTFLPEPARACGVPAPAASIYDRVARQYAFWQARVYPSLEADERRFLDRLFAAFLGDARHFRQGPVLCHGDLTSDHILFAPSRGQGIAGIIDFGDVCFGDPAGDFVWRFEYGDRFFERVLAHYRAPLHDPEAFARVVAFRYQLMAVAEIAYGLEIGNADYIAEGRQRLREHMHRALW
jgi:aminoglycoside 2''-phosphotransferase